MTHLSFFHVDAFAEQPLTGNPAAVIVLEQWLDARLMQAIAAEINLSDTAFVVASDDEQTDYDLRWFTPAREVELCGHATLAAAHVLMSGDTIRFATRSGPLKVNKTGELLQLDLPACSVASANIPGLLDALRIDEGQVFLSEAGNRNIIVLLSDEQAVRAVRPDLPALSRIEGVISVTATGHEQAIVSRVFAPSYGIGEDPVTGSAHTALVPFWAKRLGRREFTALQASARSGILHCRDVGDRVILGGPCTTLISGTLQLGPLTLET